MFSSAIVIKYFSLNVQLQYNESRMNLQLTNQSRSKFMWEKYEDNGQPLYLNISVDCLFVGMWGWLLIHGL